ncbi:hypothetical protein RND81_10G006600 [Saponaria officinalis]|uniref:Uncharacterized protein n=1 Tax=Saponaria officinalis TaxID=3572 RepID=A0AAW1HYS5_SAPOF
MKHYPKMKAMGWEIVFVPLDPETYTERYWNRQMVERVVVNYRFRMGSKVDEMPWSVMSPPAAVAVKKLLTFPEEDQRSRLVAVGKDGNIVSRRVEDELETHGVTESLFDDVLESHLTRELAFMPAIEDD